MRAVKGGELEACWGSFNRGCFNIPFSSDNSMFEFRIPFLIGMSKKRGSLLLSYAYGKYRARMNVHIAA